MFWSLETFQRGSPWRFPIFHSSSQHLPQKSHSSRALREKQEVSFSSDSMQTTQIIPPRARANTHRNSIVFLLLTVPLCFRLHFSHRRKPRRITRENVRIKDEIWLDCRADDPDGPRLTTRDKSMWGMQATETYGRIKEAKMQSEFKENEKTKKIQSHATVS